MDHTNDSLRVLRTRSLKTEVQEELSRMIIQGAIPAGERLNEAALALRFGISRGPVREAFRALEEAGLVYTEKNRGVFVREVSLREAEEIYEVREALELHVVRKLARSVTPAQIAELRGMIERLQAASTDVETYQPLNVAFHERLVALAGNEKLLDTYRRLVNELQLFRHRALALGGGLSVSNQEHRDVVEAIAAGDPDRAAAAMLRHIEGGRGRTRDAVGKESITR